MNPIITFWGRRSSDIVGRFSAETRETIVTKIQSMPGARAVSVRSFGMEKGRGSGYSTTSNRGVAARVVRNM